MYETREAVVDSTHYVYSPVGWANLSSSSRLISLQRRFDDGWLCSVRHGKLGGESPKLTDRLMECLSESMDHPALGAANDGKRVVLFWV